MILTLDIGNTNIKSAVFDGNNMVKYWRLKTDGAATSDELGIHMLALLQNGGLTPETRTGPPFFAPSSSERNFVSALPSRQARSAASGR